MLQLCTLSLATDTNVLISVVWVAHRKQTLSLETETKQYAFPKPNCQSQLFSASLEMILKDPESITFVSLGGAYVRGHLALKLPTPL